MNELQRRIYNACIECVSAWREENDGKPLGIDYDDYVNTCYNYGGSELRDLIDALLDKSSDEGQQEFYRQVAFACQIVDSGIRIAMGKRIKELRTRKRFSQQALADMAGISKANVCSIEKGAYSVGLDVLHRICNALGAEVNIVEKH